MEPANTPRRVVLAHLGEGIPGDTGYRPGRHGSLASYLSKAGFEVTRVAPSFAHYTRSQRDNGQTESEEGIAVVVPTPGYQKNRGFARVRFLASFVVGVARVVRSREPHTLIAAMPPPGLVAACRLFSRRTNVLVDIRDLWPDSLSPSPATRSGRILSIVGRLLAREMYLAHGAVGLSELMLRRAPKSRRLAVIPIGVSVPKAEFKTSPTNRVDPLRLCFVGDIGSHSDFGPLLDAILESKTDCELDVFGRGSGASALASRMTGIANARFCGELAQADVPSALQEYDVGVIPRVAGFGTCLPNKAFEYMQAGLHVAFRLEPGVGDELESLSLGTRCETVSEWSAALDCLSGSLRELRDERDARISLALSRFGQDESHARFRQVIDALHND